MATEWFEDSGAYRISWVASGVAVAWAPGAWHMWHYTPLGYFGAGTLEQNKQSAREACRAHWQITKGGECGTG